MAGSTSAPAAPVAAPGPTVEQLNARNTAVGAPRTATGAYVAPTAPGAVGAQNGAPTTAPNGPAVVPVVPIQNPNGPGVTYGAATRTAPAPRVNPDTIDTTGDGSTNSSSDGSSVSDAGNTLANGADLTADETQPVIDKYNADIQAETNTLDQQYDQKMTATSTTESKLAGRVATIGANTGAAGSGSGEAQKEVQSSKSSAVMTQLNNQRSSAIGGALTKIDALEEKELTADQAQKNKDYTAAATLQKQNRTDAISALKELGKQGVSWDTFQKDPAYASIAKLYGDDPAGPALMKAAYLSGMPAASVITHYTQGNTLTYVLKNADGSTSVQSVQLPVPSGIDLSNYTQTHDTNANTIMYTPKDPTIDPNSSESVAQQIKDQTIVIPLTPKTPAAKTSTSGKLQYSSADTGAISKALDGARAANGFTPTATYVQGYAQWVKSGALPQDYLKLFPPNLYLDPSDTTIPAAIRSKMTGTKAASTGSQSADTATGKGNQTA